MSPVRRPASRRRADFEPIRVEPAYRKVATALLDRITDRQWADIFRAAAYPSEVAERYRTHLASKIAEGLALDPRTRVKS